VERFSTIALVAVCSLVVSGTVLAFLHVYGLPAFSDTSYGRILSAKIAVFLLTLGVAGWQLMRLRPQALQRQAQTRIPGAAYTPLGPLLLRPLYGRSSPDPRGYPLAEVLTPAASGTRPAQVHTALGKTWNDWHLHLTMTLGRQRQVQFDIALAPVRSQQHPHDLQLYSYISVCAVTTWARCAGRGAHCVATTLPGAHQYGRGLGSGNRLQPRGVATLTTTFCLISSPGTLDQIVTPYGARSHMGFFCGHALCPSLPAVGAPWPS